MTVLEFARKSLNCDYVEDTRKIWNGFRVYVPGCMLTRLVSACHS